MSVVGEWDGTVLRPLSVFAGSRLVPLEGLAETRVPAPPADEEWSRLVSAALLGTERTGEAVPVPEVAISVVLEAQPERAILSSAAVLAVRRRAGRRSRTDASPLPEPAGIEDRPVLTGRTARIANIVADEERELLDETLAMVRRSGRLLPPDVLPQLMRVAVGDDELRATVTQLGGHRAAWLAVQLPELEPGLLSVPRRLTDAGQLAGLPGEERARAVRQLREGLPPRMSRS